MTSGLNYIHKNGFVHGDIKAGNVLISSSDPVLLKISDFGICRKTANKQRSGSGRQSIQVNTAPELLGTDNEKANSKSDTFSLGCMFFTFLTRGKHLFQEDSHHSFFIPSNILEGKYFLKGINILYDLDCIIFAYYSFVLYRII